MGNSIGSEIEKLFGDRARDMVTYVDNSQLICLTACTCTHPVVYKCYFHTKNV